MQRVTESDAREWIGRANKWDERMDSLKELITPPFSKLEAKETFKRLKEDLKEEVRWSKARLKENPPPVERDYCYMIQKVKAFLTVPVNSNPCSGRWHSELSYVQVDLTYFVCSVQDWVKKSAS